MVDNSRNKVKHGQSAVEFLSTYSWAFLIIVGAIAVVYFLINELLVAVPSQCTFTVAVPCSDIVITSNTANSIYQVFLTNGQDFAIKNPRLYINVSTYGNLHAVCGPSFVLSGGAIICNATTSSPFTIGTTLTGFMVFNQSVCTQIGTASCTTSVPESFNGTFTTRTTPAVPVVQCSISLAAATTSPAVGSADLLTATADISGVPIPGASVNFTSSNSIATLAPSYSLSNVNGSAFTYATSATTGNAIITAKFLKGCSATVSLSFVPPTTTTSTTVPISSSTLSSSTVSSSSTTSTSTTTIPYNFAYVANRGSNVVIINLATNTVVGAITSAAISGPTDIAAAPSGAYAYLMNYGASTPNVLIINTSTNSIVGAITSGLTSPTGVAFAPSGTYAYVTSFGSSIVYIINTATNTVSSSFSGGIDEPWGVAFAPSGTYAYITNYGSENVVIVNTATNTVVGSVTSGSIDYAIGVAFAPSGTYAYLENYGASNVLIINTATNTITGAITSGAFGSPGSAAFNPSGTAAYITNYNTNNVVLVNTATNTISGSISSGFNTPAGVALVP